MLTQTHSIIDIQSEYAPLKTVLIHEPGPELGRLTPSNIDKLLFEGIPNLPKLQAEHQVFVQLMSDQGVQVLKLGNLLLDILQDEKTRQHLLHLAGLAAAQPGLANLVLNSCLPEQIRDMLLTGLTFGELYEMTGKQLGSSGNADRFLLEPVPNAYFSRDPGAIVGRHFISCKMHYPSRIRESLILREIFHKHPLFADVPIAYGDYGQEDRPFSIEGGDIIVMSKEALAIGCGERTHSEAIALLAKRLFESTAIQRVYEIPIPPERICMHLDMIFTIIDKGLVVMHLDIVDEIGGIRRYEPMTDSEGLIHAVPIVENRIFNTILKDEFGYLRVIYTGNNRPRAAAREQLAAGANTFALKPCTIISYDHNPHTIQALRAEGVDVLVIEGAELVQGLGGPRCMTMPLQRNEAMSSVCKQ